MALRGFVVASALAVAMASNATEHRNSPARDEAPKPHVFFILVDDLGYADVGFNRVKATPEVATPTLDGIVAEGVHLTRHYVHKFCTPTRTSVQCGRLPVHVSTALTNPESPNCGIPRNMTGMAAVLKKAGYKTHQIGKVGFERWLVMECERPLLAGLPLVQTSAGKRARGSCLLH